MTGIDFLTVYITTCCSFASLLGRRSGKRSQSVLSVNAPSCTHTAARVWWRTGTGTSLPPNPPPLAVPLGLPVTVILKMLSWSRHWPQKKTQRDTQCQCNDAGGPRTHKCWVFFFIGCFLIRVHLICTVWLQLTRAVFSCYIKRHTFKKNNMFYGWKQKYSFMSWSLI